MDALVASWSAFWADAGVDSDFLDDPRDWLAEAKPADNPQKGERQPARAVAPRETAKPKIGGPRESWPQTLEDFRSWWMSAPMLDEAPATSRVAPAGKAGARLMVLVSDPAADDRAGEAGALLSGTDGRMLDAMLAAMGLTREDCYLASALPRHTPAPDWRQLHEDGLGELLRHHVALARPRLLAVFGRDTVRMIAPERFDGSAMTGSISLEGGEIPLIAGYPLGVMATRPQRKALWWQCWLGLSQTA
ncbi:uracil-DNA glycosylase family protein [Croceicoccus mobilis]|uniref:Uracil-DNA glycosylase-like domain-containing protein n=1 Tax=Croceicoccus mobilis TaxID=1703339 RepID=A0A916YPA8_9SPHN|nr:uracil-DNA glycosylase family protein [Croceicoccus mobilis]GGD54890.1 hypothetical protein GCM10010990_00010 [Croceicoccus mobilis]